MAVLYVITAGAIWILFRLVSNIIDRVKLKEFDRQLGATFGLAKGVLYCVVITFFAVTLSESSRQVVLASRSGDLIARGIRNANPILPEDIRKYLGEYIDELDKGLHTPPQNPPRKRAATEQRKSASPPTRGSQGDAEALLLAPAEGRGAVGKLGKAAARKIAARSIGVEIGVLVAGLVRSAAAGAAEARVVRRGVAAGLRGAKGGRPGCRVERRSRKQWAERIGGFSGEFTVPDRT